MVATKRQVLMLMAASFVSGVLAILLAIAIGSAQMMVISAPGFIVGAFFAFKYFTFDRSRERAEQHRRDRRDKHKR